MILVYNCIIHSFIGFLLPLRPSKDRLVSLVEGGSRASLVGAGRCRPCPEGTGPLPALPTALLAQQLQVAEYLILRQTVLILWLWRLCGTFAAPLGTLGHLCGTCVSPSWRLCAVGGAVGG